MGAHVDGVAIPGLARDDRCLSTIPHSDFDIAREYSRAAMLEDDGPPAERREFDHQVRGRRLAMTREDHVRSTQCLSGK